MSDFLTSIVRSLADKIVGWFVAFFVSVGIVLPTDLSTHAKTAVALALAAVAQMVYYAAARYIEQRWPGLGKILLLSGRQPSYGTEVPLHYRVVLDSDLMEQQIGKTTREIERRIRREQSLRRR